MTEPVVHSLVVLTQLLQICGAGFLIFGFGIDTTRWFQHVRQQGPLQRGITIVDHLGGPF